MLLRKSIPSTYARKKIFDDTLETRASGEAAEIGAGDQGIMFGYATNETEELMPLTAVLAHKLARRLTEVRENGTLSYLRLDGKTQVSVRYEDGHPVSVDTVLVSAQHDPEVTREQLHQDIRREVIVPVLQDFLNEDTRILITPTGRFVIGGPVGTAVLQDERSLSIPMAARPSTAAVPSPERIHKGRPLRRLCRKICGKNIVAAGLAEKAEIQVAYAIGVAAPVSLYVNTFSTGIVPDELITDAVRELVDLRPGAIIQRLRLQRPIYAATVAYGHFGREDIDAPWETTDLAEALKNYVKEHTK